VLSICYRFGEIVKENYSNEFGIIGKCLKSNCLETEVLNMQGVPRTHTWCIVVSQLLIDVSKISIGSTTGTTPNSLQSWIKTFEVLELLFKAIESF